MATSFSLEAVKDCVLQNGGRIRNHELVTHFKGFLNDPVDKAINREKFKDFVNELATIKVEEGEKVLVLKKKHRPDNASFSSSGASSVASEALTASGDGSHSETRKLQALCAQFEEESSKTSVQKQSDRQLPVGDNTRAQSEPRDIVPTTEDLPDGGHMSKVYSDNSLEVKLKSTTRGAGLKPGYNASSASLASTGSQGSLSSVPASTGESVSGSGEDEANVSVQSVKERALHLNKMSSEAELARVPQRKKVAQRDDDEELHTSGGSSFVTLSAEEKEWMVVCTSADYHEMHKLLSRKPNLAKLKNLSNGYTALHWAAKAGKPEVVKLLANKIGVNVNQRSYGGYTPLHLAAIHGHEDVIDLLVNTYKADVNIRDYSGKKPKQYLKNSASSRAQQLLVSKRLGADLGSARSVDDSFVRSTNARKSNRISSLLQATSSVMRQPSMRSSLAVFGQERGSMRRGSPSGSPSLGRRRGTVKDKELMPPPASAPLSRRHQADRSTSSSRESLDSGPQSTGGGNQDAALMLSVPRSESDPALTRKTFV